MQQHGGDTISNEIYYPIRDVFCKYLEIYKLKHKSEKSTIAVDGEVLRLHESNNELLEMPDFHLIPPNNRYKSNTREREELDIYTHYLRTDINNIGAHGADIRKMGAAAHIVSHAVTAKYIALHNKQILLNEMRDLLITITQKIYNCYQVFGFQKLSRKSKAGGQSKTGGAVAIGSTPYMQEVEGKIVILYNLFKLGELSTQAIFSPYATHDRKTVEVFMNLVAAVGIGALGVLALTPAGVAVAATVGATAATIGTVASGAFVGSCYTTYRGSTKKSICISADVKDVLQNMYRTYFSQSGTKKLGALDSCITDKLSNSRMHTKLQVIDRLISAFASKVDRYYTVYNSIHDTIVNNIKILYPYPKYDICKMEVETESEDESEDGLATSDEIEKAIQKVLKCDRPALTQYKEKELRDHFKNMTKTQYNEIMKQRCAGEGQQLVKSIQSIKSKSIKSKNMKQKSSASGGTRRRKK